MTCKGLQVHGGVPPRDCTVGHRQGVATLGVSPKILRGGSSTLEGFAKGHHGDASTFEGRRDTELLVAPPFSNTHRLKGPCVTGRTLFERCRFSAVAESSTILPASTSPSWRRPLRRLINLRIAVPATTVSDCLSPHPNAHNVFRGCRQRTAGFRDE